MFTERLAVNRCYPCSEGLECLQKNKMSGCLVEDIDIEFPNLKAEHIGNADGSLTNPEIWDRRLERRVCDQPGCNAHIYVHYTPEAGAEQGTINPLSYSDLAKMCLKIASQQIP